ncbi:MAG: hypothetical protein Q8R28_01835 [Dehalococcoidia bacterium]|nr:hypothetical protein [Dehalococcoidia bacterium]
MGERDLRYGCDCGQTYPFTSSGSRQLTAHIRANSSGICRRQGVVRLVNEDGDVEYIADTAKEARGKLKKEKAPKTGELDPDADADEREDEEGEESPLQLSTHDRLQASVRRRPFTGAFSVIEHIPLYHEVMLLFYALLSENPDAYKVTPQGVGQFVHEMVHSAVWQKKQELGISAALARGFYDLFRREGAEMVENRLGELARDYRALIEQANERVLHNGAGAGGGEGRNGSYSPSYPPQNGYPGAGATEAQAQETQGFGGMASESPESSEALLSVQGQIGELQNAVIQLAKAVKTNNDTLQQLAKQGGRIQ